MSYPVVQSHYQDIDGVLWGWRWNSNQPNGHTQLTYSFPTSTAAYGGYASIDGFEAFNAQQIAAAGKVLGMYDAVCNLDFIFTTEEASANLRFAETDSIELAGLGTLPIETAFGVAPDPNFLPLYAHGDTWYNHSYYNSPAPGDFAFAAGLMHEIGHALGLKHGHMTRDVLAEDGTFLYLNPALAPDHDSLEYSVMTYRSYPGAVPDESPPLDYPSTPMQNDILALQYLYGPNYNYNSGKTVYKWSPSTGEAFINGVGQGIPLHHKIFLTVWDGGGVDTYDFSNYATNAVISLAPGAWSTPSQAQRADLDEEHPNTHFARGCIANAQVFQDDYHGYIENAIGGAGHDRIIGNVLSNVLTGGAGNDRIQAGVGADLVLGGIGNDTLIGWTGADRLSGAGGNDGLNGGAGNDEMTGGLGFDKFIFDITAFGVDSVADFQDGSDKIWFKKSVADAFADFAITGNGTASVHLSVLGKVGQSIDLHGVAAITLTAADFMFFA